MKLIKILLWPFSLLYGLVTALRNLLFDLGLLKSTSFKVPVIAVGNLAVGGTGKSPHVEYITRLLTAKYKVAILSRGYGRRTRGYLEAKGNVTAAEVGDEPGMYHRRFPSVTVVVSEKRVPGIHRLLHEHPELQAIILDDAYQHRYVKPGLNILLTEYHNLYTNDWPLPSGRLREFTSGSKRADMIIVTKCPEGLSAEQAAQVKKELRPLPGQPVFFSRYQYGELYNAHERAISGTPAAATVVTGIAKPDAMIAYLRGRIKNVKHLRYGDHHVFTASDIRTMAEAAADTGGVLITTEKDLERLEASGALLPGHINLLVLPVNVEILFEKDAFDEHLLRYLRESL